MQEFFDELDEFGTPTGKRITRQDAHRFGVWHRSVHIWIVDSKGRLLLQKRSMSKETYPGLWDISCAGHVLSGESHLEAACRELQEELSLTIMQKNRLQFLAEFPVVSLPCPNFIDRERHQVFILELEDGEINLLRPDGEEVSEIRWWKVHEFRNCLKTHPHEFVHHPEEISLIMPLL